MSLASRAATSSRSFFARGLRALFASPARKTRSATAPRLEALEDRLVLTGYTPTAQEQLFLERLNDARANPAAYGAKVGVDLSGVAASQPLAFDTRLIQSSRDHSQDMSSANYFGHNGSDGSSPFQRMSADGYPWTGAAESIAAGQSSPETALSALIIDAGIPDLGHRKQLLSFGGTPYNGLSATGVGIVLGGSGSYHNYYTIDSGYTSDSRPYLTGAVFNDTNNNGLYDLGEGVGGVTVSVAGVGSTASWSSGGYSFQLSPGTYTVTASGGGVAPITRTVTVGSWNYRLQFLANQAPAPVLSSVPDQSVTAGQKLTVALSATNPNNRTLTYSGSADTQLHALKVQYGLHTDGNYLLNWGGKQDKWIMGNGSTWFFILPDGSLYQWDGGKGATGTLIANVGTAVYADPTLLTNAPAQSPATVSVSGNVLTITPTAGFLGSFVVTAGVTDGLGSDSKTFNVTVSSNNHAPVLQAVADQSGSSNKSITVTLAATDADGDALTYSAVGNSQAYNLKVKYGLRTDGNYLTNWGGKQEKWITGSGGVWFFLLPDGSLYQWDGRSGANGTLIASLGASFYADPTLLTNAGPGQAPATLSVSGNVLTITPNAGFVGTFSVTASASDGLASDSKTFNVTIATSNHAPVLQAVPDQSGSANRSLTVTLSATDADGDALTYSAVGNSQAYGLKLKYGLHTDGNYLTNWGGKQEKWIMGSGSTWFFILPNGSLYQWDGSNTASGTLIASLGASFYANPTLLTNAGPGQAPATLSVSGNVLTITPNAGFVGTFSVTASASDGLATDSRTFNVTIS